MENNVTEIMENATEAIVETTPVEPIACEADSARSASAVIKTLVIGGVIVGAYLLTKKDKIKAKITERRIKWLEKHDYTVIKNEDIVDETHEGCEVEIAD